MDTKDAKKIVVIITVCLFAGVIGWVTYQRAKVWWTASEREIVAQAEYHAKFWERKTATIERNDNAVFYLSVGSIASLLVAIVLGTITITTGKHREFVRRASVYFAEIGRSKVPVHYKDLKRMGPVLTGLTAAEQMYQSNAGQTEALRYYKEFAEISKTMAQSRSLLAGAPAQQMLPDQPAGMLPQASTPTFADLLRNESVAPKKPLILGYHNGQPVHRDMKVLKSVAFAGWQGSGKTRSAAYTTACSVLSYEAEAYVIDPHKGNEEGLFGVIQPLEATGRVTVINPFDTPALITSLNQRLNRRLRGDESSDKPILLVIDELARLAKLDCFDKLITFLERCTEETRKAGITFIGISPKWTARHFKGRADIRGCMNSALVHKCKESQAELLLESKEERRMVKKIHQPGEAVLMTDFADAQLVQMPFCTRQDMETVAEIIGNGRPITIQSKLLNVPTDKKSPLNIAQNAVGNKQKISVSEDVPVSHTHDGEPVSHTHIESMPVTAELTSHTAELTGELTEDITEELTEELTDPPHSSDEELLWKMREKKEHGVSVSQMARDLKFDRTYLSKWLNGNEDMTDSLRDKLQRYVHASNVVTFPNHVQHD